MTTKFDDIVSNVDANAACLHHDDDDDDDDDATVAATELIISIIVTDRSAQTHSDLSASTDDQSGSNAAKRRPVSQHREGTSVPFNNSEA